MTSTTHQCLVCGAAGYQKQLNGGTHYRQAVTAVFTKAWKLLSLVQPYNTKERKMTEPCRHLQLTFSAGGETVYCRLCHVSWEATKRDKKRAAAADLRSLYDVRYDLPAKYSEMHYHYWKRLDALRLAWHYRFKLSEQLKEDLVAVTKMLDEVTKDRNRLDQEKNLPPFSDCWSCAGNPATICVYSKDSDSCDYCGQPEERK